jgi:hypothetical protein
MGDTISKDIKMLLEHPSEKLMEIFHTHIRNVWRVDGLYFLGIEEKFGTEAATEIDAYCHKVLGKIECKALIKVLEPKERGIPELITALKHSCWSLDLQDKVYEVDADRAVLTVTKCGTQLTRQKKGLCVFPCKKVRQGYLESFVETFNPDIKCTCKFCPPDELPEDGWCQWEFLNHDRI